MYTLVDGRRIYEKSEVDAIKQVLDSKIDDNEHNVDGMLSNAIADINQKIADETAARAEGDSARYTKEETDTRIHDELTAAGIVSPGDLDALDTRLGAEAVLREAEDTRIREELEEVDTRLVGKIAEEAEARETEDIHLDTLIENETRMRADTDETLANSISNEATIRERQDNALQANIEKEAKTRSDDIAEEIQNRGNADAALHDDIEEEARIRTQADDDMLGKINNINTKIETLTEAEVNRIFNKAFNKPAMTTVQYIGDSDDFAILEAGGIIVYEVVGSKGYEYKPFLWDEVNHKGTMQTSDLTETQGSRVRVYNASTPDNTHIFNTYNVNNLVGHRFTGDEVINMSIENGTLTAVIEE